jgi:hypothetical protein
MTNEHRLQLELDDLGRRVVPADSIVAKVMQRVERLPAPRRQTMPISPWLRWPAIGVAAALLIGLGWLGVFGRNSPEVDRAAPQEICRMTWTNVDDRVYTVKNTPLRLIRRQQFELVRLYDEKRRTTIEVTVPRKPVLVASLARY